MHTCIYIYIYIYTYTYTYIYICVSHIWMSHVTQGGEAVQGHGRGARRRVAWVWTYVDQGGVVFWFRWLSFCVAVCSWCTAGYRMSHVTNMSHVTRMSHVTERSLVLISMTGFVRRGVQMYSRTCMIEWSHVFSMIKCYHALLINKSCQSSSRLSHVTHIMCCHTYDITSHITSCIVKTESRHTSCHALSLLSHVTHMVSRQTYHVM